MCVCVCAISLPSGTTDIKYKIDGYASTHNTEAT